MKIWINSTFAGVLIALSCLLYLIINNFIIGGLMFGTGLFLILCIQFDLITGKTEAIVQEQISILDCIRIWWGNFFGCAIVSILVRQTKIYDMVFVERINNILEGKINNSILSMICLAIFCGFLVAIAVYMFKNTQFKVLGVFLPISMFVISAFEHCVANMFYTCMSNSIEQFVGMIFIVLVCTFGNLMGGITFSLLMKMRGN